MSVRLSWPILFASAFALSGQAAAQGLPPAGTDQIMAEARSCAAATSSAGVGPCKLEADGWKAASLTDKGKPIVAPFSFSGTGKLLLMYNKQGSSPICIITARISSVSDFRKLQADFPAALGAPVKDDGKGEQLFMAPDHRIVDLAATGKPDQPAVRVAVGSVFQETK
jgi:hypothetical protein